MTDTAMSQNDPLDAAAKLCAVRTVRHPRDGRRYELAAVVLVEPTTEQVTTVERICNEPLIYTSLFEEMLGGRRYSRDDAERFFAWGVEGWQQGTHFVFVLVDDVGEIVGAIDIKSPTLESAEIGYWLSAAHSGVMTGAVEEIIGLARECGYEELYGLVRPGNEQSARVLLRAGFARVEDVVRAEKTYHRYERRLHQD